MTDLGSIVGDVSMESITLKSMDGQLNSGSTSEQHAGLLSQSTSSCSSTPLEDCVYNKSMNREF